MLVACGPDNRVALAEKLMAEKETDSAIVVMNEIKEPLHNLSKRSSMDTMRSCSAREGKGNSKFIIASLFPLGIFAPFEY